MVWRGGQLAGAELMLERREGLWGRGWDGSSGWGAQKQLLHGTWLCYACELEHKLQCAATAATAATAAAAAAAARLQTLRRLFTSETEQPTGACVTLHLMRARHRRRAGSRTGRRASSRAARRRFTVGWCGG